MPKKEQKYRGSLRLSELEVSLEGEEQSYGILVKLEAVGTMTVATYDSGEEDEDFPTLDSLALLSTSPGITAPTPPHATFMFDGKANVLGAAIDVSVFRVS